MVCCVPDARLHCGSTQRKGADKPVGDENGGVATVRADVLEHVKVLCQHHHLNDGLGVNVCSNTTICEEQKTPLMC